MRRTWPTADEILAQPCTECRTEPGCHCQNIDVAEAREIVHRLRALLAETGGEG